jgi:hypothetical protein
MFNENQKIMKTFKSIEKQMPKKGLGYSWQKAEEMGLLKSKGYYYSAKRLGFESLGSGFTNLAGNLVSSGANVIRSGRPIGGKYNRYEIFEVIQN